jgi:membrane-associated protease RseP (regulator of RpoE activity)
LPDGAAFQSFFLQSFAIFVMLAILSILIIVHECGHFLVARLFGFQTPVFGFGLPFSPHWTIARKWGTEFRIHALLLGGFVLIPELGDETSLEETFSVPLKPFRKFPIWQRALVAFAGVGFNIIFAYLVMVVMFFTLGKPEQTTVVQSLVSEIPIASKAGVKPGDELVAVNEVNVSNTTDAIKKLSAHKNELITLDLMRDGKPVKLSMQTNADGKVGMALLSPVTYKKVEGGVFKTLGEAAVKLWTLTATMLDALGQMLSGIGSSVAQHLTGGGKAHAPGTPGLGDLHGVLMVVALGADYAQQDWNQLFLFTVMISMDLAIVNLLPIPALDGGHLAFLFFEALRGRPVKENVKGELIKWGFISLLLLMAVVMVNDVTALFTGKIDFKAGHNKNGNGKAPAASETTPAANKEEPATNK